MPFVNFPLYGCICISPKATDLIEVMCIRGRPQPPHISEHWNFTRAKFNLLFQGTPSTETPLLKLFFLLLKLAFFKDLFAKIVFLLSRPREAPTEMFTFYKKATPIAQTAVLKFNLLLKFHFLVELNFVTTVLKSKLSFASECGLESKAEFEHSERVSGIIGWLKSTVSFPGMTIRHFRAR